jgi:hypothetical protein
MMQKRPGTVPVTVPSIMEKEELSTAPQYTDFEKKVLEERSVRFINTFINTFDQNFNGSVE